MQIRTSLSHPLLVDFIKLDDFALGAEIGMTFAPGKTQMDALTGKWQRNVETDVARLKDFYKTDTLVSLIEAHEFEQLKIQNLSDECDKAGIKFLPFPIMDISVPKSMADFSNLVTEILKRLQIPQKVVVHCKGGLGRTGLLAASVLIATGKTKDAKEAIYEVRKARSGTVETLEQEKFIEDFKQYWEENLKTQSI